MSRNAKKKNNTKNKDFEINISFNTEGIQKIGLSEIHYGIIRDKLKLVNIPLKKGTFTKKGIETLQGIICIFRIKGTICSSTIYVRRQDRHSFSSDNHKL